MRACDLQLERGRRYGLLGQNGVGKTTLLTRVAAGDIVGFPKDIHCVCVGLPPPPSVQSPSVSLLTAIRVSARGRAPLRLRN